MPKFPADDNLLVEALGVMPEWWILWIGEKTSLTHEGNVVAFGKRDELPSRLPYEDKQFDIVICRQMLQKTKDPELFCSELSRVAKRGFIEVPSSFNEGVYGYPDDRWLCDLIEGELVLRPKPYIRHPLANVGRRLYFTDEIFRESFDHGQRSQFFIQKVWEDRVEARIHWDPLEEGVPFDAEDPIHLCAAWLDLALNCMSFELPALEETIEASLNRANAILPGNKVGIAAAELFHSRETTNKEFYGRLVHDLRKQDLEQTIRRNNRSASSSSETDGFNRLHYGVLKDYYKQGISFPLVSIVIRTYNRPHFLERCLRSLNGQIYPAIEIIVVNDGGEEIGDILKESKYPCHYVRHADNKGKAAALNTGLRMARGTYINIVDDDDLVYPDHIALLVEALENSDYRAAYTDSLMIIEGQVEGVWKSMSKKLVYSQPYDPALLLRTNYLPVLCVLFEKSLLNECGYIDERFEVLEDWDLWIRIAQKTDFYHINQVTSEYTQRAYGDNATQELASLFEEGRKRILQKYLKKYTDADIADPIIMPKRHRTRLLSILLTAETSEPIQRVVQAFIRELEDIPWAELVIAHRLHEDELDRVRRELAIAASVAVQFVSLEEVEDADAFYHQFDFLCTEGSFDRSASIEKISMDKLSQTIKHHPLFGNFFRIHKKEPLLSIIVLVKNQLAYTKLCVESILRHTRVPYELILVDNGSTDGTRTYCSELSAANEHIKLVSNVDNKGYGGGNNQGMARSSGDWVAVLNNDVMVTKDWVQGMIQASHSAPRCGIVGPVSNYVPPPQVVFDPLYAVEHLEAYANAHKEAYAGQTLITDRVIGFCMLVKKEVIDTIGGFDLRYEIGNFEDDDFCIRAWLAGYECVIARDVFIHHFGSTTFKNDKSLDYELIYHANFLRFIEKWKIALKDNGDFNGWRRADLSEISFDTARHYCPLIPDRSVTSFLQQAGELFQKKMFSECEAVLLQSLAVHGEQPVLRYNLLVNYMQTKNIEKAGQCFAYLDEMTLEVGYLKVIWYAWKGENGEAEKLIGHLRVKYPEHPQLLAAQQYASGRKAEE